MWEKIEEAIDETQFVDNARDEARYERDDLKKRVKAIITETLTKSFTMIKDDLNMACYDAEYLKKSQKLWKTIFKAAKECGVEF